VDATYVNRIVPPGRGQLTFANLKFAAIFAARIVYYLCLKSDYRRPFWRAARYAMRRGQIGAVFGMAFIGHHLIEFTREAVRGEQNGSFYSMLRKQAASASPSTPPRPCCGASGREGRRAHSELLRGARDAAKPGRDAR